MIDRVPHPTRSIAMAFRSILVHLDSGARTSSRVAVAAAPANRHEAQAALRSSSWSTNSSLSR
jgi:hypothetical protein